MRLTKRDSGGNAVVDCIHCEIKYQEGCCSKQLCRNVLIDKLAAYEDAKEQGRLVILPCKVGDTVWFYLYEDRYYLCEGIYQGVITQLKSVQRLNCAPLILAVIEYEIQDPWYGEKMMKSEMHCSFGEHGTWVQFYLTREEAEAALNGGTVDV